MDLEKISYQPQKMKSQWTEPGEKCMIRPVQNAESNAKFPSSQMDRDQYIAAIVSRSIDLRDHPEDAKLA